MKWILCEETTILLPGWMVEEGREEQSVSSGPRRAGCLLQLITPSIIPPVPSHRLHQSCAGGTAG